MLAKDIMSVPVITVLPDTSVEEIAGTLQKWRISAVPVVDDDARLIGIVSEGDLMRRPDAGTLNEGSWWLDELQSADERARRFYKAYGRLAKDVMSEDVISVDESEHIAELARILEVNRIKRVPVMRGELMVGIVSRANLLRCMTIPAVTQPAVDRAAAHSDSPSAPKYSDDQVIRASILNRLHNDLQQGGAVNVIVHNGTVDLWGGVASEAEQRAVRAIAESTPNVQAVIDNLCILPPIFRNFFDGS